MVDEGPVTNVDLSQFSHGRKPSAAFLALEIFAYLVGWFLLLLLIALAAPGLAIGLGMLSIASVLVALIISVVQRTEQSTLGTLVSTVRPDHESCRLPGFDRPLGDIVRAIDQMAADTAPPGNAIEAASTNARIKSIVFLVLGVLLVAVGIPALIAIKAGGALLAGSVVLLVGGMFHLITRSRRAVQPNASSVLANDPRSPIVFLRSFRDDKTNAAVRIQFGPFRFWGGLRLEEALGFTVGRLGPFLAVGDPKEGLPQLGATRAYPSEAEWQKVVQHWIATARFILVLAGPTPWIRWELKNVIQSNRLHDVLLVLPPGRAVPRSKVAVARRQRWDNVAEALAETPQGASLKAIDIGDVLMVQCRPDGRIIVFRSVSDLVQDYDLALLLAIYGAMNDGERK